ncbi:hypothetical protein A3A84_00645 [Candidatus Collierbacteria bacterium RIFCSPLOWO2_01_FULL_50_23]|uniref:Uncharacterized protein n=1 Tax=Candidatus Collierbacteria bacterium RIFCSPHIGHO2_01_FULL_50_25 TaxID=1817722 RepID=A0A1F5EWZ1_9BACT|nr:MAG: hypothetical protein A2703_02020 [Candidatus Collierbacteria bacterium RIFCSPHIGHO2_01_FULL_50_25]OGD74750.1 MAG: hypothetical protein A3A84_00645 [Candidatus Collierbacteria bacterium RIFCSPLOWO2_01_FULL_50_23]
MPEFSGKVVSNNLISLRFPEGGKLISLSCHSGQIVKKGDPLAALDPKPIQTQLEIELADFRRTRAEFDQLTRQLPVPKTEDEKTKKEIAQSKLDVSVKSVEKIKGQLDGLNLYSPTDAVIVSAEGLIVGINITPSGFPIILAPLTSAVFETPVPEENFYQLHPGQGARVTLKSGFASESEVTLLSPQSIGSNGFFNVHFRLPGMDLTNFRLGTSGKVSF